MCRRLGVRPAAVAISPRRRWAGRRASGWRGSVAVGGRARRDGARARSPRRPGGSAPSRGGPRPGRARRRSRPASGRAPPARRGRSAGRPRRAPARPPRAAARPWAGTDSRRAPSPGRPAVPRAPAPRPAPADPGGEPATRDRRPRIAPCRASTRRRGPLPPVPGLRARRHPAARAGRNSSIAQRVECARRLWPPLPSAPERPRPRPSTLPPLGQMGRPVGEVTVVSSNPASPARVPMVVDGAMGEREPAEAPRAASGRPSASGDRGPTRAGRPQPRRESGLIGPRDRLDASTRLATSPSPPLQAISPDLRPAKRRARRAADSSRRRRSVRCRHPRVAGRQGIRHPGRDVAARRGRMRPASAVERVHAGLHLGQPPGGCPARSSAASPVDQRIGGQHGVVNGGSDPAGLLQVGEPPRGIGDAQQAADAVEQPAALAGARRVRLRRSASAASKRSAAVSQA